MIRQLNDTWITYEIDETVTECMDEGSRYSWMRSIYENVQPELTEFVYDSNDRNFHSTRSVMRRSIRENIEGEP